MRLLLILLLLLLLILLILLLLLFSELVERLFLDNLLPNKFNLFVGVVDEDSIADCVECEPDSITWTKLDGNTPILPFNLPFHQPVKKN